MSYSPARVQHAIAALGHFVIQCNNNYSILHKGQCLWRRQRGADGARAPPPLLCSALYDCLPRFQAARKAAWFEAIIMHSYSMEVWAGPSNAHADC